VFRQLSELLNKGSVQDFDKKLADFESQVSNKFAAQITEKCQNLVEKTTVFDQLESMNKRIEGLANNMGAIEQKNAAKSNLKEKIFKKITRHSKEYVKGMLISLIKKYQKISGLNLREIVVEEQGIVSKSSFYRLLTEIEEDDSISVVHQGKEKLYIFTLNASPKAQ
jgi:hypothetical protein